MTVRTMPSVVGMEDFALFAGRALDNKPRPPDCVISQCCATASAAVSHTKSRTRQLC
jgi:hypothetical protein